MNVFFTKMSYSKHPYIIYVEEKEYNQKMTNDVPSFTVYHQSKNGPFYVGQYRYNSVSNGVITLRRVSIWS